MIKEKYNRQKILIDILYMAIILSLMLLIANIINLDLSFSSQLFIVIIISTIAKFFMIYPLTLLVSLVLASWASYFIIKYRPFVFLSIQEKVMILYFNILANLNGSQAIIKENRLFLYLLILGLISIFTAIIVYKIKNISFLIPIYLIIFLTYWYSFIDESYIFTAIFLSLFLILFGLKKYSVKETNSKKIFNSWAKTSLVYGILIVSIAFFIPKPNDFLSWPALQQKIYDSFPIVEDLRYYKDYDRKSSQANYFNFSTSGFSEGDSVLGGPLIQSQRKVMTVETDSPLYLRGKVKHMYTGSSWENMSYSSNEYNLNQDFSYLLDREKEEFFNKKSATINFHSFSSMTLFAPYKPEKIVSNRDFTIMVNNDNIISSVKGTYKNESYTVEYLKPLSYKTLVNKGINRRSNELMDLVLYLQLPEEGDPFFSAENHKLLTDRTRKLTKTIVNDIDSDYEKAIAIQNYLRNNYKYKLDVPPLPKDQEFVDYFLFEGKEGYCTYYASAMAVMLRLEDIPSRYVEGYIVDEKIEDNKYQVRQKHAHAWVEAFIEPIGWTSFEPTAAYDDISFPLIEEDKIKEDTKEDIRDEEEKPTPPTNIPEVIEGEDIRLDDDISKTTDVLRKTSFFILISFLIFIVLKIIIKSLKYKNKEKRLNSLSRKEKIIYLYKDIVDLLELLGFSQVLGETHFDYAYRISNKSKDPKIKEFKEITYLFVKIKYSKINVQSDDILQLLNYKKDLNEKLKVHLGNICYFYRKYLNINFEKTKQIP